jgi:hypothetical protein
MQKNVTASCLAGFFRDTYCLTTCFSWHLLKYCFGLRTFIYLMHILGYKFNQQGCSEHHPLKESTAMSKSVEERSKEEEEKGTLHGNSPSSF